MKFNRRELIAACEKAIEGRTAIQQEKLDEYHQKVEEAKTEWFNNYATQWRQFLRELNQRLDNHEVITARHLERSRFHSSTLHCPDVYTGPVGPKGYAMSEPADPKTVGEPTALRQLLDMVRLADDELISVNALKEMGVSQETLRLAMQFISEYYSYERRTDAEKENA